MDNTETKICNKCKRELPITDFYFRDKAKGIRRGTCKYCHCANMKKRYDEKRQQFVEIKSKYSCAKCGDTRVQVLDFHHINPEEKDFTIGQIVKNGTFTQEDIENEIDKCIPLCANCHREFHYLEKNNNITIEQYLASN